MRIFDVLRRNSAHRNGHEPSGLTDAPPARGACRCSEHVDEVLSETVPLSTEMSEVDEQPMTVGDLIEAAALSALERAPEDRWMPVWEDDKPLRIGPFHWSLWVGDESRACYDDDAEVSLDQALLAQPGVDRVEWADREVFYVRYERPVPGRHARRSRPGLARRPRPAVLNSNQWICDPVRG